MKNKNVLLWNTEGNLRHSYQGHTESVLCVDWKDNNKFATSSQDGTIKIWDVQSSPAIKTFAEHEDSIKCLKWDHCDALLASASEDSTIKIWNVKYPNSLLTMDEHTDAVLSICWSPTGLSTQQPSEDVRIASGSADSTVKIWNIENAK